MTPRLRRDGWMLFHNDALDTLQDLSVMEKIRQLQPREAARCFLRANFVYLRQNNSQWHSAERVVDVHHTSPCYICVASYGETALCGTKLHACMCERRGAAKITTRRPYFLCR